MTRVLRIAMLGWALALPAPLLHAETEAGGEHRRIETADGIVHLWRPADYRHESAGVVVYVHGYFADVDQVWREHALAEQFQASRENALFIAPAAPRRDREPVNFVSLDALLSSVGRELPLPSGPLVVVGHSGAFRTILPWLSDARLRHLILLDGLYGVERPFHAWLRTPRGQPPKQLVVVAAETARKAERFAARYRTAVRKPAIPEAPEQVTRKERTAPVVYMRSQYDHEEMVRSGRVIPVLLQLSPLPPL